MNQEPVKVDGFDIAFIGIGLVAGLCWWFGHSVVHAIAVMLHLS